MPIKDDKDRSLAHLLLLLWVVKNPDEAPGVLALGMFVLALLGVLLIGLTCYQAAEDEAAFPSRNPYDCVQAPAGCAEWEARHHSARAERAAPAVSLTELAEQRRRDLEHPTGEHVTDGFWEVRIPAGDDVLRLLPFDRQEISVSLEGSDVTVTIRSYTAVNSDLSTREIAGVVKSRNLTAWPRVTITAALDQKPGTVSRPLTVVWNACDVTQPARVSLDVYRDRQGVVPRGFKADAAIRASHLSCSPAQSAAR